MRCFLSAKKMEKRSASDASFNSEDRSLVDFGLFIFSTF